MVPVLQENVNFSLFRS